MPNGDHRNDFSCQTICKCSHELLKKPLIVGASVSAGFGTEGPPTRLAKRFTSMSDILNLAVPGSAARGQLSLLNPEVLKDRTIVVAMDFLFWDSVYPEVKPSVQALDRLIRLAGARKIPLIIGDIPLLLGNRQINRAELNREIHAAARPKKRCYVVRLDDLHRKV